jgi:hypothetical protein
MPTTSFNKLAEKYVNTELCSLDKKMRDEDATFAI